MCRPSANACVFIMCLQRVNFFNNIYFFLFISIWLASDIETETQLRAEGVPNVCTIMGVAARYASRYWVLLSLLRMQHERVMILDAASYFEENSSSDWTSKSGVLAPALNLNSDGPDVWWMPTSEFGLPSANESSCVPSFDPLVFLARATSRYA